MALIPLNKKKGVKEVMYTEHLVEVEPGIFDNPNATAPNTKEVQSHYERQAVKILEDDKYHYECMARKLAHTELFTKEFFSVADIAGGHPKFASFLKVVDGITVYDQYAATYKKTHEEFEKRYPVSVPVEYKKKSITHPNFTPNAELAVCCHILEHLNLSQIRRLLGNLETDKILIYGPNVGRARNEKWFHFRPADHKTFATLDAMQRLVEEAGFKARITVEYHEDYLIYGAK